MTLIPERDLPLRDFIAIKMAAALAVWNIEGHQGSGADAAERLARMSYYIADAMIAERSKAMAASTEPPPHGSGTTQVNETPESMREA